MKGLYVVQCHATFGQVFLVCVINWLLERSVRPQVKRIGPQAVGCSLKLCFLGGLLVEMGKFAPHKCF